MESKKRPSEQSFATTFVHKHVYSIKRKKINTFRLINEKTPPENTKEGFYFTILLELRLSIASTATAVFRSQT